MAKLEENRYDFRLEIDSTMLVSGPSKCGKTTFVINLIERKETIFKQPIQHVWWFYGVENASMNRLKGMGVTLTKGLPTEENLEIIERNDLLIIDDLQDESKENTAITSLFMKHSHHRHYFAIQIQQHIFGDKQQRIRNLNVHYYVSFRNVRDKLQNARFLSRMYPSGQSVILSIFERVQKQEGNYAYLFVDFTQNVEDDLRLRSHIFTSPMSVYRVKTSGSGRQQYRVEYSEWYALSRLGEKKGVVDMNYSTMALVPKSKYESMRTPLTGGASKADVRMMLEPRKGYAEKKAAELLDYTVNKDNVADFYNKLIQFDRIRREFFTTKPPTPSSVARIPTVPTFTTTLTTSHTKPKSTSPVKTPITSKMRNMSERQKQAERRHLKRLTQKPKLTTRSSVNTPFVGYGDL